MRERVILETDILVGRLETRGSWKQTSQEKMIQLDSCCERQASTPRTNFHENSRNRPFPEEPEEIRNKWTLPSP